jgi:hypothetical protein
MHARQRTYFLVVTAVVEAATGVLLLVAPAAGLTLLLGESAATPDAALRSRFAGAALLAFGVACWAVRNAHGRPAQRGLLIAALIYDVAAAAALTYLGSIKGMAGVALWPAVAAHSALAVWCVVCLREAPHGV